MVLFATTAMAVSIQPFVYVKQAAAQAERVHEFNIPAKTIRQAVNDIVRVTDIDVVFPDAAAASRMGKPVKGSLSTSQALNTLLAGSGLSFRFSNANTVTITGTSQASADAQNAGGTVLETITVKSASGRTENTGLYSIESMSTATGLPLRAKDTPQSVGVVSNQQIKDQGTTTLQDVLKKTTGVNVIRDSGKPRFLSRGFYMDQLQEDGINSFVAGSRVNPYHGGTRLNDLDIYDHVELLRGPTGLVQGTGEPGGTVNLVRKRPTENFQASSVTTVGSWDKYRETLDVSGSLNEQKTLRGRVIAVGEKAGSFKDNVDSAHGTVYGVVEADIGEDTTLTAGALYQKSSETPDYYGLPLLSSRAPLDFDRSRYLGASWNDLDNQKENVFVELGHQLTDDWKLDLKANYTHYDSSTAFAGLTRNAGVASNGLANVNNMLRYDNDGGELGLEAKLTGKYDLFDQEHDLFAALSYTRGDFDSRYRRVLNGTPYNVYTFTGNEIIQPNWDGSVRDDIYYDYNISETAFNLGTRYNIRDDLHLVAGGRLTKFEYGGTTHYVTFAGAPDGEISKSSYDRTKFIPYLGLTYDLVPNVTLYASYADIFKPQTALDVSGKMLPPVEGTNYEIGVKTTLLDERLNASFALFQINQKNRAIAITGTNFSYAEGEVKSRGLDIELSGEVLDGLNLFAGYTFNRSKYLNAESTVYTNGAFFSPHTPVHMFRLHSTYKLPVQDGKWTVGGGVQIQSDTRSVNNTGGTGGIEQGGYGIWDASLKYDFDESTALQLVVNNIFDKRYFENNRTRTLGLNNFYGAPRNFALTLTKKF